MSVEEPIGPLINLRNNVLELAPLARPTTEVLPGDVTVNRYIFRLSRRKTQMFPV